jgi:hypothetical protein
MSFCRWNILPETLATYIVFAIFGLAAMNDMDIVILALLSIERKVWPNMTAVHKVHAAIADIILK